VQINRSKTKGKVGEEIGEKDIGKGPNSNFIVQEEGIQ
jgi:hypothetical protein